jgi:hypothetical protein
MSCLFSARQFQFKSIVLWCIIESFLTLIREYLSQRHFSSVLYLNGPSEISSNDDSSTDANFDGFIGGDLCFQDDVPDGGQTISRLTPRAGRLVAYRSDANNVHKVSAKRLHIERFCNG